MAEKREHAGGSRNFTLNEVLNMLEFDDLPMNSATIFVQPPGDGSLSDEDDDNDDVLDGINPNSLPPRQLCADAEASVHLHDGTTMSLGTEDTDNVGGESLQAEKSQDEEKRVGLPKMKIKLKTKKRDSSETRVWRKENIPRGLLNQRPWEEARPAFLDEDVTPVKGFERFFDYEVINHIINETIRYARSKGDHNFSTTHNEIRAFLAILFISGYASLPRRSMYWEPRDDVLKLAVSKIMSRNRFDQLMKYLHLANNDALGQGDRMAKVRPMYKLLNKRFLTFYPMEQNLSVDESMVPYFGKHSMKQCIRGKPIRFGFKQCVLATPLGYAVQISPYQGAQAGYDRSRGLGFSVVMDLISCLPKGPPYQLYFDNFFTGLPLLKELADAGMGAIGTVRSNRVENCPVKVQELSKEQSGTFDYRHGRRDNLFVCSWNDNSIVTLVSNCTGAFPTNQVQRWSMKESKKVQVEQPHLISCYNKNMGGVDRMDQNVGCYRIRIRSKKWWWPLFAFLPEACMQNAWLLYRMSPSQDLQALDLLGFKRSVVDVYTRLAIEERCIEKPLTPGRQNKRRRVSEDIRLDGKSHHLITCSTQRRCRQCGKKTKLVCPKCEVPLHLSCSKQFHS